MTKIEHSIDDNVKNLFERVSDNDRESLLLQSYSNLHETINRLHARSEKITNNNILIIGGIYSLYYSDTKLSNPFLLVIPIVISFFTFLMVSNMWETTAKHCMTQCKIEDYFKFSESSPKPSRIALHNFYFINHNVDLNTCTNKEIREKISFSDKQQFWSFATLLTVICSLIFFANK